MHSTSSKGLGRAWRGLTLIELAIAMVMLAMLLTMAVPSMSSWLARHRLRAAAQHLVADLGEARQEAVRLGRPVHVVVQAGENWCYALALSDQADCHRPDAQILKRVGSNDLPGVRLTAAAPLAFDGRNGASFGPAGYALWVSPRGEELMVRMSTMGRAALCAPQATLPGVTRC